MNVKRFFARTSREAMAQIRAELGDDAVVLKTRKVNNGVEIMAMADGLEIDDEQALTMAPARGASSQEQAAPARAGGRGRPSFHERVAAEQAPSATVASARLRQRDEAPAQADDDLRAAPAPAPRAASGTASSGRHDANGADKTPAKPMSTLTFQQFVRDRLALRKGESRSPVRDAHDEPHLDAPREPAPARRAAGHGVDAPRRPVVARHAEPARPADAPATAVRYEEPAAALEQPATARVAAPVRDEQAGVRLRDRADIAAVRQELAAQLAMPAPLPAMPGVAAPALPAEAVAPFAGAAVMPAAAAMLIAESGSGVPPIAAPVAGVMPAAPMTTAGVMPVAAPMPMTAAAPMTAPAPMMPAVPDAVPGVAAEAGVPSLVDMLRPAGAPEGADLMSQLREMRGLISNQLSSLALHTDLQRDPVRTQLLRGLLGYGFSPLLVRKLIARLPSDYGVEEATAWAASSLARLVRIVEPGQTMLDKGGIYAMTGPTGVGKTTTTAKIAAQFALRHGVGSIGLLTVDAYRIGAQDQLRTFGRLLGVPVHVVHDATGLAEFMNIFMNKKLVLIDTVGVGQRDERVSELLASLASASINRLLVLNAAAQVETLDDVIGAYRADSRTGVIVSKLDEAVKVGGVVDCLIRHRLPLVGMADGQRVPEDWHFPEPAELVRRAMTLRANPVFDLDDNEMTLLLDAMPARPAAAAAAGVRSV